MTSIENKSDRSRLLVATAPADTGGSIGSKRTVSSAELLGDGKELFITHEGEEYRLRLTSKSRLILTK